MADHLDEKFFSGRNIPSSVADSVCFRITICTLKSSYESQDRKALVVAILVKAYGKLDQPVPFEDNAAWLSDGWKNSTAGNKNVVTMLHNASGSGRA